MKTKSYFQKTVAAGLCLSLCLSLCLCLCLCPLPAVAANTGNGAATVIDGQTSCVSTEIYPGVTSTHYTLSAESSFKQQDFTVVEFDPAQSDLYFDVVGGGEYINKLATVSKTVKAFNASTGRKTICALNGDLWMITSAHARVEGKGTSYGGYSDPVVTKSFTIPRGFNMYGGQIVSSTQMRTETPYEGDFYAFGITDDGIAVLGRPLVGIKVTNTTKSTTTVADGLNRLPANDSLVMYTDVSSASNYSLSDAYEIIISAGNYSVSHGSSIRGKIEAITRPGQAKESMKAGRIILTARGDAIAQVSGYAVGDEIVFDITLTDAMGNNEIWQKMTNAVGGHIPVIVDGVSKGSGNTTYYPMSVLGIKADGRVVMMTNDGRQSGYSVGIQIGQLDEICESLGIVTAFILDGGGSATMVQLTANDAYKVVNRPSDGNERSVVNSVILSAGPDKGSASGDPVTSYVFNTDEALSALSDPVKLTPSIKDGELWLENTDERNMRVSLSFPGMYADEYDYMVVTYKPVSTREEKFGLGFYFCAGTTLTESTSAFRCIYLERTGGTGEGSVATEGEYEYESAVVDLTAMDMWKGRVHRVIIHPFEYLDRGNVGEGVLIRDIAFYKTLAEAEEAAAAAVAAAAGTTADDITSGEGVTGGCGSNLCAAASIPVIASAIFVCRGKGKRKEKQAI